MKTVTNYKGVDFDVDYEYQKEIPEVRYYPDGSGQPGEDAYVEINTVFHKGTNFTDFINNKDFDEIEKIILQEHEK